MSCLCFSYCLVQQISWFQATVKHLRKLKLQSHFWLKLSLLYYYQCHCPNKILRNGMWMSFLPPLSFMTDLQCVGSWRKESGDKYPLATVYTSWGSLWASRQCWMASVRCLSCRKRAMARWLCILQVQTVQRIVEGILLLRSFNEGYLFRGYVFLPFLSSFISICRSTPDRFAWEVILFVFLDGESLRA